MVRWFGIFFLCHTLFAQKIQRIELQQEDAASLVAFLSKDFDLKRWSEKEITFFDTIEGDLQRRFQLVMKGLYFNLKKDSFHTMTLLFDHLSLEEKLQLQSVTLKDQTELSCLQKQGPEDALWECRAKHHLNFKQMGRPVYKNIDKLNLLSFGQIDLIKSLKRVALDDFYRYILKLKDFGLVVEKRYVFQGRNPLYPKNLVLSSWSIPQFKSLPAYIELELYEEGRTDRRARALLSVLGLAEGPPGRKHSWAIDSLSNAGEIPQTP